MVGSLSEYNNLLQENDPPPWLHRMRELGYPPGYLGKLSIHLNISVQSLQTFVSDMHSLLSSLNHILD